MYGSIISSPIYVGFIAAILATSSLLAFRYACLLGCLLARLLARLRPMFDNVGDVFAV